MRHKPIQHQYDNIKRLFEANHKDKEEALKLAEGFMSMVRSTATPEQIEALDEAAALESIAHMPARVKCATLGWKTMQKMLNGEADKVSTENDLE